MIYNAVFMSSINNDETLPHRIDLNFVKMVKEVEITKSRVVLDYNAKLTDPPSSIELNYFY